MAAKHDLTVYQGDDHTWGLELYSVDITDPDNPIRTPYNLNQHTLSGHIRTSYADNDATVDANFTFLVTDAIAGKARMILSSENTATMSGRYRWDLQIVRDADDYVTTLVYGTIKVQQEVTRP